MSFGVFSSFKSKTHYFVIIHEIKFSDWSVTRGHSTRFIYSVESTRSLLRQVARPFGFRWDVLLVQSLYVDGLGGQPERFFHFPISLLFSIRPIQECLSLEYRISDSALGALLTGRRCSLVYLTRANWSLIRVKLILKTKYALEIQNCLFFSMVCKIKGPLFGLYFNF